MKIKIFFFVSFFAIVTLAKAQSPRRPQYLAFAYEGGTITHPGLSVGYSIELKQSKNWALLAAAKTGFYYHRGYQSAVFILPNVQGLHQGKKGFFWGPEIQGGIQRTFIPDVYSVADDGSVTKEKFAGMGQWVFAPAFRFGNDLSFKKNIPLQWFINPQLQFRWPSTGRMENYLLMGIGINYNL